MTSDEFNEKYKANLEEGHYGLAIDMPLVVDFLDKLFSDLVKIPGFQYSQIKLKFNSARFYTNLGDVAPNLNWIISREAEKKINDFVFIEDEINKRLNQPKDESKA